MVMFLSPAHIAGGLTWRGAPAQVVVAARYLCVGLVATLLRDHDHGWLRNWRNTYFWITCYASSPSIAVVLTPHNLRNAAEIPLHTALPI
jgi:hypothetical protein